VKRQKISTPRPFRAGKASPPAAANKEKATQRLKTRELMSDGGFYDWIV
jgi:hypothetical protein